MNNNSILGLPWLKEWHEIPMEAQVIPQGFPYALITYDEDGDLHNIAVELQGRDYDWHADPVGGVRLLAPAIPKARTYTVTVEEVTTRTLEISEVEMAKRLGVTLDVLRMDSNELVAELIAADDYCDIMEETLSQPYTSFDSEVTVVTND